ncbi:ABC transporter permease [Rhodanobacter denitrificans]|uniref:ABC-type antimicrobial peptide transport system, permease component n=1 Tax=Rhodanobacter denitrificans TaxID=666685 RepID=M4NBG9_9GAMM|nr:FtsX-like permease family protein [Rhodanobacter denitrificans]AGG87980.1 ABC-type antimicrobial peptide transport system, permease component [Rhodanobacter denitrificans]UJM87133.1 ABC transporter permease [Rhodanobacter denitrificans]
MQLRHVLAALPRHKLVCLLVVVEIAVAFAILCNAVFIIRERVGQMQIDTGIAESRLIYIHNDGVGEESNALLVERNLLALRSLAGVESAVAMFPLPLENMSINFRPWLTSDMKLRGPAVGMFVGTPGYLDTLGLKIVQGRDFNDAEYDGMDRTLKTLSPAVIVTRDIADKLWPGQNPIGKKFWRSPSRGYTVVGVVERLVRGYLRKDFVPEYSAMFPVKPVSFVSALYVMRVAPSDRDRLVRESSDLLLKLNPDMLIDAQGSYADMRADYFRQDGSLVWLLALVCLAMLLVTALGIAGLANFWVQQRRRNIGIRRAIGATRGDILRYFQLENFLIVSGGIALGMLLAYGINLFLMPRYELPRLPPHYLPVGALALWALGQLAVLGPALRAAAVPPVVATRSV